MKRTRESHIGMENFDMGNCLLLLSGHDVVPKQSKVFTPEVFECKTCNRQFPSFQALGGHRASHKRPKLEPMAKAPAKLLTLGKQPKLHECSLCGVKFSLGQALGGHMRRHRAEQMGDQELPTINDVVAKVPVLKRSNSTRIICLDLNLTPLENDLKLLFGKMIPTVNAFV